MPHQSQLSPDVAHGDDPRKEDTGQPGADVQEVRGRIPTHRTTISHLFQYRHQHQDPRPYLLMHTITLQTNSNKELCVV